MAIKDEIQPKQIVECDLCKQSFKRELAKFSFSTFDGPWENISIWIMPHIDEGSITVEHACLPCRRMFLERVRLLIAEMTSTSS